MKTCIHCGKKIEDKMMVCIFCKGSQDISAEINTEVLPAEKKPALMEEIVSDVSEVVSEPLTAQSITEEVIESTVSEPTTESISEDEKLITEMIQSHEESEIVEEAEDDEEEIDDYYANVLPDIEAALKKNTNSSILMATCMIISALMIVYVCLSVL